jgi:hypothetical protein
MACSCGRRGLGNIYQRNTGKRSVSGRLTSARGRHIPATTLRALEINKQRDYAVGLKSNNRTNINKLRAQAIQKSLGHS